MIEDMDSFADLEEGALFVERYDGTPQGLLVDKELVAHFLEIDVSELRSKYITVAVLPPGYFQARQ
eukprot:9132844-Pyramimonas_sp.AAC.1